MDDLWKHLSSQPFGAQAAQYLCKLKGLFVHNQTYDRKAIVTRLVEEFKRLGGDPQTEDSFNSSATAVVKKQLSSEEIPFRRISKGIYKFLGDSNLATQHIVQNDFVAECEYGTGSHEVYAWFLPRYRSDSSNNCWPIKIGRTGPGGLKKRLADFDSNLPECPYYLMRLGCVSESEASKREMMLHHYFQERDKDIKDLPGQEWFNTNSDEINTAIAVLFPRAYGLKGSRTKETGSRNVNSD